MMRIIFNMIFALFLVIATPVIANEDLSRSQGPNPAFKLFNAATNGNIDAAQAALNAGADINAAFIGITPLYQAASHGHVDFVQWAILHRADVNYKNGPAQRTALHEAVRAGHPDVVTALIVAGADVNALNSSSRTPMFYTNFIEGNAKSSIVRMLTEAGGKMGTEATPEEIENISNMMKQGEAVGHVMANEIITSSRSISINSLVPPNKPSVSTQLPTNDAPTIAKLEQPSVLDILSETPAGKAWLLQQPDISFDELMHLYPEAKLFLSNQERINMAQHDPWLRKKLVPAAQEQRSISAANELKYCSGSWVKLFSGCLSYKLGMVGLPAWAVIAIVMSVWLIPIILLGIVFYILLNKSCW